MTPRTLRDRIAGDVVSPADAAYDQHRNVYIRESRPGVVVRATTSDDVQHTLEYAQQESLALSVRGGGHSYAGFGTNDDGVVLDLSPLNAVDVVDSERRVVRLGGGATWIEVATALAPRGLAITAGDTTTVGVGGLILGGGIGWMVRKYGLTIDSLVAAEVVTADGRVLRASADEHADLFWAIRGGGGNFGVVTSFDVVAQPVREVLYGTISYPAADVANVLKGWRDAMRKAPDDLSSTVQVLPKLPGLPEVCMVIVCVPAGDEAAATVEPLRQLGDVVAEDVATRPYAGVLEEPPPVPPGASPVNQNSLTPDLSDELIDRVTTGIGELAAAAAQFRSLGGAAARVPSDATAYAHRDIEALVVTALFGGPPEAQAAFRSLRESLAPHTAGSYSNLMNVVEPSDVRAIYPPATYERLAAVKQTYDPDNLFSRNYNIPPPSKE